MVPLVVAVVVTPGPVFLLLPGTQLAEILVAISVGLIRPTVIIDVFVAVPVVIVGVVGIVHAVIVMFASYS